MNEWVLRPSGYKILTEAVAKHCFSLTRADVGKEVEREYRVRMLDLSPALYKVYDKLEKDWLLGDQLVKWSGERWNDMRALCSGLAMDEYLHNVKLDELVYLLTTELQGQQVIIWAHYRKEIERIVEHLGEYAGKCGSICGDTPLKERSQLVQDFRAGAVDWLVVQPETMKTGTNLTGADAVIYFSSPAGLVTRQQTEARSEDIDGTSVTLIIDLITRNTVEADIYESLRGKENSVKQFERMRKAARARQCIMDND
jgi:SNF2 family DNA or RNA helicase